MPGWSFGGAARLARRPGSRRHRNGPAFEARTCRAGVLRAPYQAFEKMGMRMGAIAQQPGFGKRSQSLQVTRWIAKAHVDAGASWWRGEALTSTGQGRLRWFHCESPLKVPWKCHLRDSPNLIPRGGALL